MSHLYHKSMYQLHVPRKSKLFLGHWSKKSQSNETSLKYDIFIRLGHFSVGDYHAFLVGLNTKKTHFASTKGSKGSRGGLPDCHGLTYISHLAPGPCKTMHVWPLVLLKAHMLSCPSGLYSLPRSRNIRRPTLEESVLCLVSIIPMPRDVISRSANTQTPVVTFRFHNTKHYTEWSSRAPPRRL